MTTPPRRTTVLTDGSVIPFDPNDPEHRATPEVGAALARAFNLQPEAPMKLSDRLPAGQIVTLWHPDGLRPALDDERTLNLLQLVRPRGVMLHAGPSGLLGPWRPAKSRAVPRLDLTPSAKRAAEIVREIVPDVVILFGVGYDGIASKVKQREWSIERAVERGLEVAALAHEIGAAAVMYDPEAAWKVTENSREWHALGEVARGTVKGVRDEFPDLAQLMTTYDHLLYHPQDRRPDRDDAGVFNYSAWLGAGGVEGFAPQVYAGDGDDNAATFTSTKGALARMVRHEQQLEEAVKRGWLREDFLPGGDGLVSYIQSHSVSTAGSVWLATQRRTTCWWATPHRADDRGVRALAVACELNRRGFLDEKAVERFQTQAKAGGTYAGRVDGLAGDLTAAALSLPTLPRFVAA